MKFKSKIIWILFVIFIYSITIMNNSNVEAKLFTTEINNISDNSVVNDNVLLDDVLYKEVFRNSSHIMYADMSNGLFAIQTIADGKIWYSTPVDSKQDKKTKGSAKMDVRSQIVISYISAENTVIQSTVDTTNSEVECVKSENIKVEKINNGIRVIYTFKDLAIIIPVSYTLEDNHLNAQIITRDIKEGNEFYLTAIQLLPTFGGGNWIETGYLFVPDGSGALVNFNNNKITTVYDKRVYGEEPDTVNKTKVVQTESIYMPVFGIVKPDNAIMGVVTKGDDMASICAISGNDRLGYNSVSSKMNVRVNSQGILFDTDFTNRRVVNKWIKTYKKSSLYQVQYYFLGKEKASYVGIAQTYQEYLKKIAGLSVVKQTPVLNVDTYGSIDITASFLGFTYSKQKSLTTFEQTQKIAQTLKTAGINDMSFRLIGWSNYGVLNNKLPTKAKPINNLGGTKEFNKLKSFMSENGIGFSVDVDLIRHRSGNRKDAAKTAFEKLACQYEYLRSVYAIRTNLDPVRLATPSKLYITAAAFLKSFQKYKMYSISLSSLGKTCYSDFSQKGLSTRRELLDVVSKTLQEYKTNKLVVTLEKANAYTFSYANKIIDAPTYSSGNYLFDKEVPFYQLVLHGYITTTTAPMVQSMDEDINFLKAVESGSEIIYAGIYQDAAQLSNTRYDYLYSSTYTWWMQNAINQYTRYYPILKKIYDKPITNHQELQENVMMTTYENGIHVLVNYNKYPVKVGEQTIAAMDYAIAEGD